MSQITNRQAICDVLMSEAQMDREIVVLCSDSRGSASMTPFFNKFPKQSLEVGIAEQNLVSVAAGLALSGKKAFAVSPASFLSTRSYEQIKVDVAYSAANVKLIGISGGISYGALGMTHHSCQDVAALCALPGMRVYLPSDAYQTSALIRALLRDRAPAYVRITRGASAAIYGEGAPFQLNKASVLADNGEVLVVACGEMVAQALKATQLLREKGISCAVIDMYCLKPFDDETLLALAKTARCVVTMEEHSQFGGLGSITAQILSGSCPRPMLQISLPDEHLVSGTSQELFAYYRMDGEGAAGRIFDFCKEKLPCMF